MQDFREASVMQGVILLKTIELKNVGAWASNIVPCKEAYLVILGGMGLLFRH